MSTLALPAVVAGATLDIPDAWRFDPCILSAAITRQPAAAGFFTPDGTTIER